MAGINLLFRATLLSRQRFMRHHAPRTVDMLFLSWLVIVILIRFMVNCLLAARLLTHGPSGVGQAITEFSMLHFSVIAFLLPLLSSIRSFSKAASSKLGIPGPYPGRVVAVRHPGSIVSGVFQADPILSLIHI